MNQPAGMAQCDWCGEQCFVEAPSWEDAEQGLSLLGEWICDVCLLRWRNAGYTLEAIGAIKGHGDLTEETT